MSGSRANLFKIGYPLAVSYKWGLPLLLVAAVLTMTSCRFLPRPDAWQNFDLYIHPPEAEGQSEGEVEVEGQVLAIADTIQERGLRALLLKPGNVLRWKLELGSEPTFRTRPFAQGQCRLSLEVASSGTATPRESAVLHDGELPALEAADTPPAFLIFDLDPWAGRAIELTAKVASIEPGSCQEVKLASASLAQRRPRQRYRGQGFADRTNVVLLSIDTLRADALGFWGHTPSLTPAIDALAARGDTFPATYTTINSTNPSFVSMMTGLYPKNHHVYDLVSALPASQETLIERFDKAGYITRAVLAATHLGSSSGLHQGVHALIQPVGQFYGETVTNVALHYLQEPAEMPEPFFLWLHYFDPHVPHNPPAPWAEGEVPERPFGLRPVTAWQAFRKVGRLPFERQPPRFLDGNRQLYMSEVAYVDRQVERVLQSIEEQGLADRTLLVFVADHGETLGEHGNFFDHVGLHTNTTHVPMVVLKPGQKEGRLFPGLVQSFDLFPTILRLADLDVPTEIDARDLYELGEKGRRAVFAEHAGSSGAMVRTERYLYYRNFRDPLFPLGDNLYDLEADAGETKNLAGQGLGAESELQATLDRFLASKREMPPAVNVDVTPEERERLRALGYIH